MRFKKYLLFVSVKKKKFLFGYHLARRDLMIKDCAIKRWEAALISVQSASLLPHWPALRGRRHTKILLTLGLNRSGLKAKTRNCVIH
jgi:hypothetical protein